MAVRATIHVLLFGTLSLGLRDFLLFIPANAPNLHTVLSYYSSTARVNPEGDVQVSDETIHGLGIKHTFLQLMFGSIINIARAPRQPAVAVAPEDTAQDVLVGELQESEVMAYEVPPRFEDLEPPEPEPPDSSWGPLQHVKPMLIAYVPNPGYFIAGGLAGIISRTSTAPLDRLKVYLIAQTGVKEEAAKAAKGGAPLQALKHGSGALLNACKDLWRAGGMRSLFAGTFLIMAREHAGLLLTSILGNGLNVVKVMPESAIKFGSYEVRISAASFQLQTNRRRRPNELLRLWKGIMTRGIYTHGQNSLPVV